MKCPIIELSFDDGHELDVQVIDLLDKYNFKGMFYIPIESWGFDNLLVYRNHEIGGHTATHPSDMKLLDDIDSELEIVSCKQLLEERWGKPVESFCYPRGRYGDREVDSVKRAGFKEARTTKVLHTKIDDPFRKHTTIHIYPRKEYGGIEWDERAMQILCTGIRPEYFHLWGHSWEIHKLEQWQRLDNFLQFLNAYRNSLAE